MFVSGGASRLFSLQAPLCDPERHPDIIHHHAALLLGFAKAKQDLS